MSQKGMKLTKILQTPNQYPQANMKYQPLRKNILNNYKKSTQIVQKDITQVSYVSKRFKSLSPDQSQLIKNTTFLPVNCKLKITQNAQKRQRATSIKYRAINIQQSQKDKPISPKTFEKVIKNTKTEVVYQYNCPKADQTNLQDLQNSKYTYYNNQAVLNGPNDSNSAYLINNGTTGSNNRIIKNYNGARANQQNNKVITNKNSRISNHAIQLNGGNLQNTSQAQVDSNVQRNYRDGKISTLHQQKGGVYLQDTFSPNVNARISNQNNISDHHIISNNNLNYNINTNNRQNISQKKLKNLIQGHAIQSQGQGHIIQNNQGNKYNDHLTGGNNKGSYHHYQYQYPANEDNKQLDGPAFFQNQGRGKYNQIGQKYRQQYEIQASKRANVANNHPQNIKLGGRSKSISKNGIIQDFQSSIGINSRHNNKNMGSTKEYSTHPTKQQILEAQQTQVKGDIQNIYYENQQSLKDDKSRMREYVQNVQSRIVIGADGRNKLEEERLNTNNSTRFATNKKIQTEKTIDSKQKIATSTSKKQLNSLGGAGQNNNQPQLEQRNRKLRQYQQAGNQGYNFKKNQQSDAKRKKEKQQYKYNLYSILDQQVNLKCATGLCKPNQICASEPKNQGWK